MKLTKCVNGHFYDEEKFETCPHCAGTSKLNASNIFGQSSAPKLAAAEPSATEADVPVAESDAAEDDVAAVNTVVEENSDAGVALEWEPAAEAATDQAGFTAPPEEPEFVDVPKEPGFTAPPEEPEFVDASTGTTFTEQAEEPEFSPAPQAAEAAPAADAEMAFDINSQPSFDTPLDFDSDFATVPATEETDSGEEQEEEEGFELLSKYSSDNPAEENQEAVESVTDSEPEEQPAETVEEADTDSMNGLLSEGEIAGDTSQPAVAAEPEAEAPAFAPEAEAPAFSPVPETPAFAPEAEAPAFSPVPEAPAFSPEAEAPAFSPVPEATAFAPEAEAPVFAPSPEAPAFAPEAEIPTFSTEPEAPAFVPEQPAAFGLSSDEDDDDDGHTVAFYDDIFTGVAQTAVPASDPFAEAANAVAMNATTGAAETSSAVPDVEAANVEATNIVEGVTADASASNGTVEEPNVFTAPPLPKVSNLPTPCVGWLIALNGTHVGQDFHLRVGKNYVGRDESMDVALTGDKSVSRHKHAIVVYEPKHHKYFVQPGESNELIYVNDEVVLLPMELKPYDLLVIGDIELWFMPLCDAEHNWSEIIRKLQEQMQ